MNPIRNRRYTLSRTSLRAALPSRQWPEAPCYTFHLSCFITGPMNHDVRGTLRRLRQRPSVQPLELVSQTRPLT